MVQSEAFISFSLAMIQSTSDLRVLARQVDAVSTCQQELVPILSTDKQEPKRESQSFDEWWAYWDAKLDEGEYAYIEKIKFSRHK